MIKVWYSDRGCRFYFLIDGSPSYKKHNGSAKPSRGMTKKILGSVLGRSFLKRNKNKNICHILFLFIFCHANFSNCDSSRLFRLFTVLERRKRDKEMGQDSRNDHSWPPSTTAKMP